MFVVTYHVMHQLTICGGLGGSGDNSQFGGFMFLSSEAVTAIERRCFTGNGGGSWLLYV